MSNDTDDLTQLLGFPVPDWKPPPAPAPTNLEGRLCHLEPLNPERHAESLYTAYAQDTKGQLWTYLPYGPFATPEEFREWLQQSCCSDDPLFYTIIDTARSEPLGVASYLRIMPAYGSIEVGHINYSPMLQRTAAATEAMYLMMRHAFELGYRRYEWKCNALNASSRAAAQRLGFSYEGVFRQAGVFKGRNRDTAWYAAIDKEWPELKRAFERWLHPSNFDAQGRQMQRLSTLTRPILKQIG